MMVRDSFCCPKVVPVRAFSVFVFLVAFAVIFVTCLEKIMWVSKVTPSMVGSLLSGRGWLSSVICGWSLDSQRSGVRRVTADFEGDTVILFEVSQCSRV